MWYVKCVTHPRYLATSTPTRRQGLLIQFRMLRQYLTPRVRTQKSGPSLRYRDNSQSSTTEFRHVKCVTHLYFQDFRLQLPVKPVERFTNPFSDATPVLLLPSFDSQLTAQKRDNQRPTFSAFKGNTSTSRDFHFFRSRRTDLISPNQGFGS